MNKGILIGLGLLGLLALSRSSKAATTGSFAPIPPPGPLPSPPSPTKPEADPIPTGWVAAMPTPEIERTRADIQKTLGSSPPGTRFPFMIEDKKYLAQIMPDGQVAILQPEDQV